MCAVWTLTPERGHCSIIIPLTLPRLRRRLVVQRATRGQFLAIVCGFGVLVVATTRLTSCDHSSSFLSSRNSLEIQQPTVLTPAAPSVNPSCIVCVARATE